MLLCRSRIAHSPELRFGSCLTPYYLDPSELRVTEYNPLREFPPAFWLALGESPAGEQLEDENNSGTRAPFDRGHCRSRPDVMAMTGRQTDALQHQRSERRVPICRPDID